MLFSEHNLDCIVNIFQDFEKENYYLKKFSEGYAVLSSGVRLDCGCISKSPVEVLRAVFS